VSPRRSDRSSVVKASPAPHAHDDEETEPVPAPSQQGSTQIESVIGWRVRSRAREVGLSSAELAKKVGLSRAMISKIENAQVSPSLATLSRLAEVLEVPITSLFQGLDEERDALYTKSGGGPEL